jgi:phospholipase/carboxylesterase
VTFLPAGYEPNYPYPLVVFFHGQGGNEKQIVRLAPRLSRRNYICVGLRGPQSVIRPENGQVGYSWNLEGQPDAFAEEYVFRAVEQARRSYHVHSERIFLAGFCEGASLAYRLGLSYPDKFAGVISLNGQMPRGGRPLLHWPKVRDLRILIGHGIANPMIPLTSAKRDHKLLYVAGIKVHLRTYPTTHRIHPDMLKDIDRWIMGAVDSAEL